MTESPEAQIAVIQNDIKSIKDDVKDIITKLDNVLAIKTEVELLKQRVRTIEVANGKLWSSIVTLSIAVIIEAIRIISSLFLHK